MTPWELSTKLLNHQGRNLIQHSVLRENLATYLTQLKPEFLDKLQSQSPDLWEQRLITEGYSNGPMEMIQKISRDLVQKPYNDQAVQQRLEILETELKDKLKSILQGNQGYPSRVYIAGSLLKGRFGANSDLDLLCETSPQWSKAHYTHAFDDVSIQYFQPQDSQARELHLASFTPTLEIDPHNPPSLKAIYSQALKARGYLVDQGHLQAQGPIVREVEIPPSNGSINWSAPMMV